MNNSTTYASPLERLLAALIDFLISTSIIIYLLSMLTPDNSEYTSATFLGRALTLLIVLVYLGIVTPLLTSYLTNQFGGSFGKLLTGVRVQDQEGKNLTFRKSLFRSYIATSVGGVFFFLGFLWIFRDPKRQGWHDQVTGSFVTVKNPGLKWVSVLVLIGLIALDVFIIKNSVANIINNQNFYLQLFSI